jgi:hypothetical protein
MYFALGSWHPPEIVIHQVVCHDSILDRILIVGCARTGHGSSLVSPVTKSLFPKTLYHWSASEAHLFQTLNLLKNTFARGSKELKKEFVAPVGSSNPVYQLKITLRNIKPPCLHTF